MFGRSAATLTMPAVAAVMEKRGYQAEFQPVWENGKVGRIAASLNGVNFFVNFLGNTKHFGCVSFFTVAANDDGRSMDEANQFNEATRSAKIVLTQDKLCLMHDFVVPKAGMAEELFTTNLDFWNFAMSEFGKWYLGK